MNGKYTGYLNTSRIYADQIANPQLNPNGVCRITLNASAPTMGQGRGGSTDLYEEIFNKGNTLGPCISSTSTNWKSGFFLNSNNFTKVIYCCVGDDIQFDGHSKWEKSIDDALKDVGNMVKSAVRSKFGSMGGAILKGAEAAYAAVTGAMGVKVQSLAQTIKFWTGSEDPGPFNLKFNMLATAPDVDIRKELLALYATVFPAQMADENLSSGGFISNFFDRLERQLEDGLLSAVLVAPLGYNPVDAYKSSMTSAGTTAQGSGLIDVKIGNWLHLSNMVAKDFTATISRVTTRYGYPLYAKCGLVIQPCRAWRLNDVRSSMFGSSINLPDNNPDAISKYKLGETP